MKRNYISMKVRKCFMFHLKYLTTCSNYSILFNQILVKLHFITDLTAFKNASVISHFIRRVDMVYMLSKALSCNLEVLLYS